MIDAPLALALTAGMVGAINPCAFSLLPAYVGMFVAGNDPHVTLDRRLVSAARSATGVTVGFVAVFTALGVLFDSVADRFRERFPWITIAIGALLVVAGVAAAFGRSVRLLPMPKGTTVATGMAATVAYGAVYALASLSCTIGPFLAITAVVMERSVTSGLSTYATYGLGMGVVILIIAAGSALATTRPADGLRRMSRHAPTAGGVLMILSGAYAIWYGRWELSVYAGDLDDDGVVNAGEKLRVELIEFVERVGAVRLTIAVLTVVSVAIIAVRIVRRRPPLDDPAVRHAP